MYTIYFYCLAIGLIALFLSLLLDGISDVFQGLTFFDFHFDALPGILPLSPLQICGFLTGFGGMGITLYKYSRFHVIFAILTGLIIAYGTYFLLARLKKVNSDTLTESDIIGMEGTVIVTIFKDSVGSVSLNTKVGKITYSAISDHDIKQGTIVKVIEMNKNTIFVTDDNHYFLNVTR